jgi:hypothetical protein
MSTLAIMTRLQLNWQEISGIARAFLYEPETAMDTADLPAVYPVILGRMTQPIPRTSAGQYIVVREYIYRVLIAAAQAASTESDDQGAFIDSLAVAFIDNPADYFMLHPRLSTAAFPELQGATMLERDVSVQDSGPVMRLGPGGAQYRAIDYTITIAERRIPTVKRLS